MRYQQALNFVISALYLVQFALAPSAYAEANLSGDVSTQMEGFSITESNQRQGAAQASVQNRNEIVSLAGHSREFLEWPKSFEVKWLTPFETEVSFNEDQYHAKSIGYSHPSLIVSVNEMGYANIMLDGRVREAIYDYSKQQIGASYFDLELGRTVNVFIQLKITSKGSHAVSILQIDDGINTDRYAFSYDGRLIRHKHKLSEDANFNYVDDWMYEKINGLQQVVSKVSVQKSQNKEITETSYVQRSVNFLTNSPSVVTITTSRDKNADRATTTNISYMVERPENELGYETVIRANFSGMLDLDVSQMVHSVNDYHVLDQFMNTKAVDYYGWYKTYGIGDIINTSHRFRIEYSRDAQTHRLLPTDVWSFDAWDRSRGAYHYAVVGEPDVISNESDDILIPAPTKEGNVLKKYIYSMN